MIFKKPAELYHSKNIITNIHNITNILGINDTTVPLATLKMSKALSPVRAER